MATKSSNKKKDNKKEKENGEKKKDNKKDIVFFPKENRKRLLKDITNIMKHPLTDEGILYFHDETNFFKGKIIIFGPKESLYENGVYMFEIKYTCNYPYEPPIVKYLTNDGKTRFHPNLYRNGKVCLSLLNTWKGEQWTACQTIRSVLITLLSLLHNKPLLNEPGIKESNKDFIPYNKIIEYMNIQTAINGILEKKTMQKNFYDFWDYIINHFKKEADNIINRIENLSKIYTSVETNKVRIYDMKVEINYKTLLEKTKKNLKLLNK